MNTYRTLLQEPKTIENKAGAHHSKKTEDRNVGRDHGISGIFVFVEKQIAGTQMCSRLLDLTVKSPPHATEVPCLSVTSRTVGGSR